MKHTAPRQLGIGFAPSFHRPFLRYFAPVEGEAGKAFEPISSQEDFDKRIQDRLGRAERTAREDERSKFADYDALKADAEKFRAANAPKPKDDDKPSGVTEDDVEKRISDALAAERLELALERVSDQLDKALEGRTYAASQLFALDRKQFVKDDGKTVDGEALKDWVEKNSKAVEPVDPRRRPIPGQGARDSNASGSSVQAGRDLYSERHGKKNTSKE